MEIDQFGRATVNSDDAFTALYNGSLVSLDRLEFNNPKTVKQFNQAVELNADAIAKIKSWEVLDIDRVEFDKANQEQWFMPEEYKTYNIIDWVYSECHTVEEKTRVTEELDLFAQHNMLDVLRYCKYLVDTMRENNIVWGVGRGSSVASYCLYLIGVHKVDSIKYKLDIKEFLK